MRVLLCLCVIGCAAKVIDEPNPGPNPGSNPHPPPPGSSPPPEGRFHTRGRLILDQQDHVVHLRGISWFGLETPSFAPHGLWARSMDELLDDIQRLGFNLLRVPFSNQLFDAGSTP